MNRRTFTVGALTLVAGAMTLYCHSVGVDTIFPHFYYLPIILAAIWWERRSWFLTASLCAFLLASHVISGIETSITTDLMRGAAFLLVGGVLAELSRANRQAGEALRASYRHQASILESMLDAVIVSNPDGVIHTVNRAALELLGYAKEEIIGQPVGTIFEEEEEEEEEEFFRGTGLARLVREGAAHDVELTLRTRSGERIPVMFNGSVIRDSAGRLSAILGVARDMREHQRAEEALRRYAGEQAALYAIASAAAASLEPDTLLSATLDAVLPILDSDAGWVTLPGPTLDDPPRIAVWRNVPDEFLAAEMSLPLRDCPVCAPLLVGAEARTEPILCAECPRLPTEVLDEAGLHSHVGIPLTADGQVLGVLNIGWSAPRVYTEADRALLTAIGQQVGLALRNAQLYQAARQVDRLRVLNELDRALAATLAPDTVVEITLQQLAAAVDAPMGALFALPLPEGGQAAAYLERIFILGRGWVKVVTSEEDARHLRAFLSYLRESHETVPLSGDELAALIGGEYPGLARRWGPHGLVIPIFSDGTLMAVLALGGRPANRPFTDEDRSLALAAASRAGQAIQRARQHQAVQEAEERYRAIVEDQTELICRFLPDGTFTFVNDAYCRYFNKKREELIGYSFMPLIPEEEQKIIKERLASLSPDEPVVTYEHRVVMPNGERYWQQWTDRAIFDEQGHSIEFQAVGSDITERKRAEQALRESEARLTEAQRIAHLGNWDLDIVTNELWWSDEIYRIFGLTPQEFGATYDAFLEFVHPDDRELVERAIDRALHEGQPYSIDHRIVLPDGSERTVHTQGEIARDESGQPLHMVGTIQDVTERVWLEEQLAAIYQLGRELTLLHDEEDIIQRVLEASVGVLQFKSFGCGLVDQAAGELVFQHRIVNGAQEPCEVRLPLDGERGVGMAVVRSGQALNVPNTAQDPRYVPILGDLSSRSELCVPMKVGERVIGVLNIESRELDHFTPADEQLLQTLADQAVVALENARLYRASQEQVARLAALNTISAAVVSSLEPDTVLCQALESVCQVLDAVEGSILLRDSDTGELVFKHVLGDNEVFLRGQRLAPGQGVAGWVAQHSQAVCVNDVRHDARFYAGMDTVTGFETRSLLCAPLLYRGEIVGVTEIVNKRQGRFTSEDLNLLEAASFIVTQSLENARLYQDLLIQMQAREKAQAQLVHSEKMGALGRLTASLAHEINNPLQAMQSCLTLATERLEDIPHGEKLDRYLSIIGDETERVSNIVRRVSGFYRPAREELRLTDLHTVLESTLQLVGKQLQHADITVEREWTEELPLIPANPDQLKQVCLNLVLNALDAMPEGGTLRVRTALEAPDFLRIEFSDTGVGMSPETQSRLFEPFFTTKEQGSGLGLSISYGIIKAHNGEITVTSEEGRGTTFTILLPVEGKVKRET